MKSHTIQLSTTELTDILQAYNTLKTFLEKLISPNEIYRDDFLKGLQAAQSELDTGKLEEVKTFDDFIR
ncbi:MAG: hypothetical protein DRR08_01310 [Candidatus Parabeggiatoa sp. nov. 2]|nr:MAG: hypothetical protein B6247_01445 [Beggiatoa sp. 4572_84]RKZ64256.1 MAG: hypothetical protein DRR08_01310 [Gammaproteobacteria bacterium]